MITMHELAIWYVLNFSYVQRNVYGLQLIPSDTRFLSYKFTHYCVRS